MKKSLILLCALATMGLFASCQKESVSSGEVQPSEELNVISVDTWSDKADLEPLLVFAEEIVGINQGDDKKETALIIKVLREFFQSVGNIIGRHDETPTHTLEYFGNRRSFGLAIDQIRELSYNLGQTDVPYLRIQLGNANELKIGSLEVMPVSNFLLDIQGGDTRDVGRAELGKEFENGHARILVSDALFVKFSYNGSSYAFAIYAEESDARYTKTYVGDESAFGLVYGSYFNEYPTLMDWYNNSIHLGIDETIRPIQSRIFTFPVARTLATNYLKSGNKVNLFVKLRDMSFLATSGLGGVSVEIHVGNSDLLDSDWMEAYLYSSDESEVRDLVRDYLWASIFGCTQSECRALSAEFAQAFDETVPECNQARLNNWYEFDGQKRVFQAEAPLAIVPRAASGMVWKPSLGLKLTLADGSTRLISFAEFDALDGDGKQALWDALFEDPNALPGIFSVAGNKKVKFSRGNLVATIDADGAPTAWKFHEHQYGVIGASGANVTIGDTAGDVDLFCWSTDAANNNWGIHTQTDTSARIGGNFNDWGKNIGDGKTWRTLSAIEWDYLFNTSGRMVNSKPCYTNLTDGVTIDSNTFYGVFVYPDDYDGDVVSSSMSWDDINAAGIVFLPAAGRRFGSSVTHVLSIGACWSSSSNGGAIFAYFHSDGVNPDSLHTRNNGISVRLVQDVEQGGGQDEV